jgi:hypothetical protein
MIKVGQIKWTKPSFIAGLLITGSARKKAGQLVLQNMEEKESFFEYVLLHKGAVIWDENGKEVHSEFLTRMGPK